MTTETVGIRELQQHSSRLVREVEQGGVEYRISVQGRDTGVMLTKAPVIVKGVTIAEAKRRGMWQHGLPEARKKALLDFIEAGREEMGYIGQ